MAKTKKCIKVVFVGDKPSQQNISQYIPFVGTKSFSTLVEWINHINPDYYVVINSDSPSDRFRLMDLYFKGKFTIVALGENAYAAVVDSLCMHPFKLPHPSGLNRKLNDKKYIKQQLKACKQYVRSNR